jgi:hypothetical protein
MTFEPNAGQASSQIEFLARGPRLSALFTHRGLEIQLSGTFSRTPKRIQIRFAREEPGQIQEDRAEREFEWAGIEPVPGETNYFIGNDPSRWRTHVPHFARVQAGDVVPGVDVIAYGRSEFCERRCDDDQLEFDLRVTPSASAENLRLKISGADDLRLNSTGDLTMHLNDQLITLRKPLLYEEPPGRELRTPPDAVPVSTRVRARRPIGGGYLLEPDGSIGFRTARRDPRATLVIDPSLSVTYSTFLGGAGADSANSIALDASGKLYVAGTTTSASTFAETVTTTEGPGGGTDFFIAKIDPTVAGPSSLVYLTFLGGSGNEAGGAIAVDGSGNAAVMGATTSPDFPVTDKSTRTSGPNDVAITELGPTGATLVYSTLFGGSGSESVQNPGGLALDQSGDIYVASDTNSTDLPVTTGAFQSANGGGLSDGFLAVFRSTVTASTPHLKYCTYLGINAQVGIGGVAVDSADNAYIAGFTSNPGATFPTLNGYQTSYAGDPFDAFVIKLRPSGNGANDLAYGTFLGGAGLDKALAIAVGSAMPATAYVTGTTQSTNFPTNGTNAAAQSSLKGTANAFFSAIAQDATTGMTSLLYSTFLGGTQSDSGLGVKAIAPASLYVAGKTTSWDFPWLNNLQPFNGNEDAFVAKLNPTAAGQSSLLYATPLAGTTTPGGTGVTDATAITANASGSVYVAGLTTSADFPRAGNPGNGFQPVCSSCQQMPVASDAFLTALQENAAPAPSLSFTAPNINFGAQSVGARNVPPLFASLVNTGTNPLNVSSIAVSGPNSASFSLVGTDPCIGTPLATRASCSFEVGFSPTAVGPVAAFVAVTDDATGSPQLLAVFGIGSGPLAVPSATSIAFGNQPQGSTSDPQTVTMSNTGNQTLHFGNIVLGGANTSQFLPAGDTCIGASIAPGNTCTFSVVFAPNQTGSFHAEIDVFDDSGGVPGAEQIIMLSGIGLAPAPVASVSPGSLVFGLQAVGTQSGPQSVTLMNLGSAALTLSQLTFTGPDAASFAVAMTGSTCPTAGGTLAIAASCKLAIDFAPQASGPKSATLNFIDNAPGSPQIVSLSGMAIAPVLHVSPSSLTFAPQSVGIASASQTITLSNTGTSPVSVNQMSVTGTNPSDFSQATNCGPVLGPGMTCSVNVTFKPTAAGNRVASILISDDAAGSPQSIPLAGTGTQSAVSLSPSSVTFAAQLVGTASQSFAITLNNTGTGALAITSLTFSGTNPADFSEKDTCKGTVAPGANCAVNVTFTPASAGSRSATLLLTDNAPDSPQSVPLTGPATDFDIDPPAAGNTSATVTAGQTATYNLDVQSIDNFAGSVNLTCTGAPAAAVCSLQPTTLTVTPNSAVPFQVQVSTAARPAAASPSNSSGAASNRSLSAGLHAFSAGTTARFRARLRDSFGAVTARPLNVGIRNSFASPLPMLWCFTLVVIVTLPPFLSAVRRLRPHLFVHGRSAPAMSPGLPRLSRLLQAFLRQSLLLSPPLLAMTGDPCARRLSSWLRNAQIFLAVSLATTVAACGSGTAPAQAPGTPAGNYTLTITASSSSSTGLRTLSLSLSVN